MAAQEAETEFNFYLRFAKPLVLNLNEPNERALAAAWIQKLRDQSVASDELRTNYLKLLLFVLQRQKLIGPFSENPNQYKQLENLPTSNLHDVARELLEVEEQHRKQRIEKGKAGPSGDFPPYITEYSADLLEYSAAQDIPNFGVQAYYAFSKEPITTWQRIDKGVFPKGLPTTMDNFEATIEQAKKESTTPTAKESSSKKSLSQKKPSIKLPSVQLSSGEPPLEDEREPPSWGSNLIGVTDPRSSILDKSPPKFYDMETLPSLGLPSDTIDENFEGFNKITATLIKRLNDSISKSSPAKRTDMSTSYGSIPSPYQKTPRKLYSPLLPTERADPFFLESPPIFVDDDNLPSLEFLDASFPSPFQQTPSPRKIASPYRQTPSPRERLSFIANNNLPSPERFDDSFPSPYQQTPSPSKKIAFGYKTPPFSYRRTRLPRKRLSFTDTSTTSTRRTLKKLYSPQLPQGSADPFFLESPPSFIDDDDLPSLERFDGSYPSPYQQTPSSRKKTSSQSESDTSPEGLKTPQLTADDVLMELDREITAWEGRIAEMEAEYEAGEAHFGLPVEELIIPKDSEASPGIFNLLNEKFTERPVRRPSRLPRAEPRPQSRKPQSRTELPQSRLRPPPIIITTNEQHSPPPLRNDGEQKEEARPPQRRQLPQLRRQIAPPSSIPSTSKQPVAGRKKQILQPPSSASTTRIKAPKKAFDKPPRQTKLPSPRPGPSRSRQLGGFGQSSRIVGMGTKQLPQLARLPSPKEPSPRTKLAADYEEYQKRYQYRHPGMPRTPPVFSRFRSLMGEEGSRQYHPSEFGADEYLEWQPGEEFFFNRTALSPRTDIRERRYKPFSDRLTNAALEDLFLVNEVPELVEVNDAEDDDDFDNMSKEDRSPVETPHETFKKVQKVVKEIQEMKKSSPAEAGIPLTTPRSPPSPIRVASTNVINDTNKFMCGSSEKERMAFSPKCSKQPPVLSREEEIALVRTSLGGILLGTEEDMGLTDDIPSETFWSPPPLSSRHRSPILSREEEMAKVQATLGRILQDNEDMGLTDEFPFELLSSPPQLSPRSHRSPRSPKFQLSAISTTDEMDLLDEESFPDIFTLSPELPSTSPRRRVVSPLSSPESPRALVRRLYAAEEPPYKSRPSTSVTVGRTSARKKKIHKKPKINKMVLVKERDDNDEENFLLDVESSGTAMPHRQRSRLRRRPNLDLVHEHPINVQNFRNFLPSDDLMGKPGFVEWESSYTELDDLFDIGNLPPPMQPQEVSSRFEISPPKRRRTHVLLPHEGGQHVRLPSRKRDIIDQEYPVDFNLSPPPMSPSSLQTARESYILQQLPQEYQNLPSTSYLLDHEELPGDDFVEPSTPPRRTPPLVSSPELPTPFELMLGMHSSVLNEHQNRENMPVHVGRTRSRMRVVDRRSGSKLTSFREELEDSIAEEPFDLPFDRRLAYPDYLMGETGYTDYEEQSFSEIDKSFENERLTSPIRPQEATTYGLSPQRRVRRRRRTVVLPEPGLDVTIAPNMRDVLGREMPPDDLNTSPPPLYNWELPFRQIEAREISNSDMNFMDNEEFPDFFDILPEEQEEPKTPPPKTLRRREVSPSSPAESQSDFLFRLNMTDTLPVKSRDHIRVQVGKTSSKSKNIRFRDKPTLTKMPRLREVSDVLDSEHSQFASTVEGTARQLPPKRRQRIRRSPRMEIVREHPMVVPNEDFDMPLPEDLMDVASYVEYEDEHVTDLDTMFSQEGLSSPMRPSRFEETEFGVSPSRRRQRRAQRHGFPHEGQDVKIRRSLRDLISYESGVDLNFSPPPMSPSSLQNERQSYILQKFPREYQNLPSNSYLLDFEEFPEDDFVESSTPPRRALATFHSPELSPQLEQTLEMYDSELNKGLNRERIPVHVGRTRSRMRVVEKRSGQKLTSVREDLEDVETHEMPFYSKVETPYVDSITEEPYNLPFEHNLAYPQDLMGGTGYTGYQETSFNELDKSFENAGLSSPVRPETATETSTYKISPPRRVRRRRKTVTVLPEQGTDVSLSPKRRDVLKFESPPDMAFSPPHMSPSSLASEREFYRPQQDFPDLSQEDTNFQFGQSFATLPADSFSYLDQEEMPDMFDAMPPEEYFSPDFQDSPESLNTLQRRIYKEDLPPIKREATVVTVGKTAGRQKRIKRKSRGPNLQKIEEIQIYEEQLPSEASVRERTDASMEEIAPDNLFGEFGHTSWEESMSELDKTPPRSLMPPMSPERPLPDYLKMYAPAPRREPVPVTLHQLQQEIRLRPSQRDILQYERQPEYYSPPPYSSEGTPPRSEVTLYKDKSEYYSPAPGAGSMPDSGTYVRRQQVWELPSESGASSESIYARTPTRLTREPRVVYEDDIWESFPQTAPFADQPENPFESLDTSFIAEGVDSSFIEEDAAGWKWLD